MKTFFGNLWTEEGKDGRVNIGFSRRFIEERLVECFHVIQADMRVARKDHPLMVIETNDGLESLKSPITGSILVFNHKARNFPDRLTEDDNIMEILPEGVTLPVSVKKAKPVFTDDMAYLNQTWSNRIEDLFTINNTVSTNRGS
jgi:glycine cleavage system H lipoate-binding protein